MPAAVLVAIILQTATPPAPVGGAPNAKATRASAVRATTPVVIDGRDDDEVWRRAPAITQFREFQPKEDGDPRFATEAKVAYDDRNLYVFIRAFDPHPDSILKLLARRDVRAATDQLKIMIDSYHDRRNGFEFAVNPAGVKRDYAIYNDNSEDDAWDAVWDVATTVDSLGWTAEFRIPLSQLRYDAGGGGRGRRPGAGETTWGVNFCRDVARRQEWSCWAPIPQGERRFVSRFGELTGLDGLPAARRREVLPYARTSVTRAPGSSADPFFQATAVSSAAGVDAKLGLPAGLTLDLSVHPDFGQVEADPSEVNLSEFETTFAERRPFFLEGAGMFQMSIYESPGEVLFYPRRIGRVPELSADERGGYAHAPGETPILAAAKLSGKTRSGWSVGALDAVTGGVYADVRDSVGAPHRDPLEPASNYGVLRLQKDLRGGRSAIGVMGTVTNRLALTGAAADSLRSAAYAGALDFRHRFGGATGASYEVLGAVFGSSVDGSAAAIARTQRSSAHYFQRPDAPNLTLDTTRTSLAGWGLRLQAARITGRWRYGNALYVRSPGFEVNDLGIEHRANWIEDFVWVGHEHTQATRAFNFWSVYVNTWSWWTLAGERYFTQANIDLRGELRSFWGGFLRVGWGLPANTLRLRGGPLLAEDGFYTTYGNLYSPWRGTLRLDATFQAQRDRAPGTWAANVSPTIQWQPTTSVTLGLGPSLSRQQSDMFYVDQASTSATPHYVVSRINWTTRALTARLDVAFAPNFTFQLYAQPFLSSASYRDFKEVVDPRAGVYANRFRRFTPVRVGDEFQADLDGDGLPDVRFDDPAFNVKRFRSNAVFRWEYRPGSTVFVVWSQGRDAEDGGPPLFRIAPENVFLVKWSYWMKL